MKVAYSPHYSFDLGPHQFPMDKYRAVHDTLRTDGTVRDTSVLSVGPVADEDLLRVHTPEYVHRLRTGTLAPEDQRRLGFPWSEALVRRAEHATQGTLTAARQALRDGLSANLAGGSHHAFAGHGEGYCAFNDMAVAIRALREEAPSLRVAVVDCDVHQGNGTAAILGDDPLTFTFSIHCESNYPLRKVPGSRDLGLRDGVADDEYLHLLARELDDIWERFRPELVFFQAGVDPLASDRLGRLSLTRNGLRRRDALVLRRCLVTGVPAVVVLGGGYAREFSETVEAHADTIRAAKALYCGDPWP